MAINIKGAQAKSAPPPSGEADLSGIGTTPAQQEAATEGQASQEAQPTQEQASPPAGGDMKAPGHQTGASFLLQGDQQKTHVDQVKALQDLRSKLRTSAREFWLNPGEFAKLYFLDGNLLSDGIFDTPMVNTHFLQIGGNWSRFICNKHTEGECVVCNSNADGSQPGSFQLFTVINVMPWTIRSGDRKGQVLPARLQLFAATMKVREKLAKRAANHGGKLAGSLYNFSRSSKQDPRTGDDVEFLQEVPMNGVLQKYPMLGTKHDAKQDKWVDAPTTVLDYAKVYPVLTNAEIAQLRPDLAGMAGFTGFNPGASTGPNPTPGFGGDPTQDLDDEIPF